MPLPFNDHDILSCFLGFISKEFSTLLLSSYTPSPNFSIGDHNTQEGAGRSLWWLEWAACHFVRLDQLEYTPWKSVRAVTGVFLRASSEAFIACHCYNSLPSSTFLMKLTFSSNAQGHGDAPPSQHKGCVGRQVGRWYPVIPLATLSSYRPIACSAFSDVSVIQLFQIFPFLIPT